MKEKLLLWLCDYSQRIIAYIFWIFFLFIFLWYTIFSNNEIPKILSYCFWLLLGLYAGFNIAIQVVKYLQSKRNPPSNTDLGL